MLGFLLFLAQAAAAPAPAPSPATTASSPAPVLGNAPQPAAVSPTPSGPRSLADIAKGRKLNHSGSGGGTMSATSTSGSTPLPSADSASKSGARGAASADPETYWRDRYAVLKREADQTASELQRMYNAVPIVYHRNGDIDAQAWAAREAAVAPYKLRAEDASAALARLPEECRTTPGCSPGWIR